MPRVDDGLVDQQLRVAVVGGVDLILVAGMGDDGVAGAPGVGIELDHVGFVASDHQLACPGRQRCAADGLGVVGVEPVLLGQGQQVLLSQDNRLNLRIPAGQFAVDGLQNVPQVVGQPRSLVHTGLASAKI